jgi:DNA end-binding protein Ku
VRSQAEIEEAVEETKVKKPELDLARQVIDSLVAEFDPSELQSTYRRDLRALLESKLSGQPLAKPEEVPEAPVIDLMEALRASVAEAAKSKKKDAGAKTARPRTRAAAGGSRKR